MKSNDILYDMMINEALESKFSCFVSLLFSFGKFILNDDLKGSYSQSMWESILETVVSGTLIIFIDLFSLLNYYYY